MYENLIEFYRRAGHAVDDASKTVTMSANAEIQTVMVTIPVYSLGEVAFGRGEPATVELFTIDGQILKVPVADLKFTNEWVSHGRDEVVQGGYPREDDKHL